MIKEDLEKLMPKGESQDLEWKANWPPELLRDREDGHWDNWDKGWDKGRGELLKDLISLANSHGSGQAYLVCGVKDLGSKRKVLGLERAFDEADIRQWVKNTFDPIPKFQYSIIEWSATETIVAFKIERTPNFPHVVKENLGGILCKGQVWYREGTQNNVALHSQLTNMFREKNPFLIPGFNDKEYKDIENFYKAKGREVYCARIKERDVHLNRGYEIAYWFDTRREVVVGTRGDPGELIMLLEPME